jgi:hypothetical protein
MVMAGFPKNAKIFLKPTDFRGCRADSAARSALYDWVPDSCFFDTIFVAEKQGKPQVRSSQHQFAGLRNLI